MRVMISRCGDSLEKTRPSYSTALCFEIALAAKDSETATGSRKREIQFRFHFFAKQYRARKQAADRWDGRAAVARGAVAEDQIRPRDIGTQAWRRARWGSPTRHRVNGLESLLIFDAFEFFDFGFPTRDVGSQFRAFFGGQGADLFAPPKLDFGLLQIEPRPPQVRLFDEAEALMPGHALFVADVVSAGEGLFSQFVKLIDRGGDQRRGQSAPLPLGLDEEQVEQRAIFSRRDHRRAGECLFVRVRSGIGGQAGGRSRSAMFAREIIHEVSARGFGYLLLRVTEIFNGLAESRDVYGRERFDV